MWVGRNEPPALSALGPPSPIADELGADFLFLVEARWVIVQRKEVRDLVASMRDPRMAELRERSVEAGRVVLLVEGDFEWDRAGNSRRCPGFTRAQWTGVQLAVQEEGMWLVRTDDLADTAATLLRMEAWFAKPGHGSLFVAPRSREPAGVQHWRSLGAGPTRAKALYDTFGSPFHMRDELDETVLRTVAGIGPKLAAKMMEAGRNGNS